MSELPFMPLHIDTYEAHTPHLTLEEDGMYLRLLRLMWRSPGCSVPDDQRWLQRQLRVSNETFVRVALPLIDEFCTRKNGKITQRRLVREWLKAKTLVEKRKQAGKKGGDAKALKEKEIASSKATVLPKHIHEHEHKEIEPITSSSICEPRAENVIPISDELHDMIRRSVRRS